MHVTLMFHDGSFKNFRNARNVATRLSEDGEERTIITMRNGDERGYAAAEVAAISTVHNDETHFMRGIADR